MDNKLVYELDLGSIIWIRYSDELKHIDPKNFVEYALNHAKKESTIYVPKADCGIIVREPYKRAMRAYKKDDINEMVINYIYHVILSRSYKFNKRNKERGNDEITNIWRLMEENMWKSIKYPQSKERTYWINESKKMVLYLHNKIHTNKSFIQTYYLDYLILKRLKEYFKPLIDLYTAAYHTSTLSEL